MRRTLVQIRFRRNLMEFGDFVWIEGNLDPFVDNPWALMIINLMARHDPLSAIP